MVINEVAVSKTTNSQQNDSSLLLAVVNSSHIINEQICISLLQVCFYAIFLILPKNSDNVLLTVVLKWCLASHPCSETPWRAKVR